MSHESNVGAAESDLIQLITPTGEWNFAERNRPYRDRLMNLTSDDKLGLYRDMVLTRRFDDESTALQRQGELALFAPAKGQEAAQIGSGRALAERDYVFPSYREHGVAHARGVDPVDVLRLFRGVQHGGWNPAEHNFHLYTLVIGSHTLHATGYAMSLQRRGLVGGVAGPGSAVPNPGLNPNANTEGQAVIAYFGDGATSQGDVNEAMVFAAAQNAPIVFFCQNNQWAISVPVHKQSKVPLVQRASGFGIPGIQVDGNDVLACYAATTQALERARNGGGPTFIEAVTFRMGAHTTSDDPTRYRTKELEAYWRDKDPIDRYVAWLRAEGLWDEECAARVAADADRLGERLRTEVRTMDAPPAETMFDNVYAGPHAGLAAERQRFMDPGSATGTTGAAGETGPAATVGSASAGHASPGSVGVAAGAVYGGAR